MDLQTLSSASPVPPILMMQPALPSYRQVNPLSPGHMSDPGSKANQYLMVSPGRPGFYLMPVSRTHLL